MTCLSMPRPNRALIRRAAWLLSAVLPAACHFSPMAMLAPHTRVEVREVWRSQFCNAPDEHRRVFLFETPAAFRQWAGQRQLDISEQLQLQPRPHALVEQGRKNTGGYGLAVSRDAVIRGDQVIALHATFLEPPPGRMVPQALSSPCALVELPKGTTYQGVLVYDQDDKVVASSKDDPAVDDSWLPFR